MFLSLSPNLPLTLKVKKKKKKEMAANRQAQVPKLVICHTICSTACLDKTNLSTGSLCEVNCVSLEIIYAST